MRTDPFTDTAMFLVLADQTHLGLWRWVFLALFYGLLIGGLSIAVARFRTEPEQRAPRHLMLAFLRMFVGAMWFQNLFWKLPFGVDNGLTFWTKEMATKAAFPFYAPLVNDVLLPNFWLVNPAVFLLELGFAVSLMLGLGVRLMGLIGVGFVLNLWLGLYRHPHEWPWTYMFLAGLLGLFAVEGAGRSLGLDGLIRRRRPHNLFARYAA
jgi:uncharacterized membrane protein YphA (DoxX/SURF4 family)